MGGVVRDIGRGFRGLGHGIHSLDNQVRRDFRKANDFRKNVHNVDMDVLRGKGLKAIERDSPGGRREKQIARIAGTLAAAYFTGGAVGGLAGGGLGGAVAGGAAGGATAGALNNDDNRWKGAAQGAAAGGLTGGAYYGAGQLAGGAGGTAGSTNAGGGINPSLADTAFSSGVSERVPSAGITTGGYTGEGINPNLASNAMDASLATSLPATYAGSTPGYTGEGLNTGAAANAFGQPISAALPGTTMPISGFGGGGSGGGMGGSGVGLKGSGGFDVHGDPIVGGPASSTGGSLDPNAEDSLLPRTDVGTLYPQTTPGLNATGPASPMTGTQPGIWDRITGGLTGRNALKYGLPLAYGAMSAINSRKKLPGEDALGQQAGQYGAMGTSDINNARAGVLQPWQDSQVKAFTQQQSASAKQMMVNLGMDPSASSQMLGLNAAIAQQAEQIRGGYLQQNFSQGMQEMGIADNAQQQYVQLQLQRRAELNQALSSAMTTMAFIGMM